MAQPGDTRERFGRSYIFMNPTPALNRSAPGTVGTWRIRTDDTGTPPIDGPPDADLTFEAVVGGSDDILVGNLVYLDSNSEALLADASSVATAAVAGMAIQAGAPGETVRISRNEPEDIFTVSLVVDGSPTFLTPGSIYYLSTNPGKWTTTPDTTTPGAVVRSCGLALDNNKMSVEIQVATVI